MTPQEYRQLVLFLQKCNKQFADFVRRANIALAPVAKMFVGFDKTMQHHNEMAKRALLSRRSWKGEP